MRPPNDEGSELSKFHFPCNKEKDELYILSLESVTSIQKPINLLRQCIIQSAVCYIITFILVIK